MLNTYRLVNRMYRGMGPPLLGVTPIFAISFWVSTDPVTQDPAQN